MKHTVPASTNMKIYHGSSTFIHKIAWTILIFIFIQLMNRFLILTGSALEQAVAGRPNPQFVVGVFQQLIQASTGILFFRLIFKAGVRELGINLRHKRRSIKYFFRFALLWSAIIVLYILAAYFLFPNIWASLKSVELPQTDTIISTLLFQSFFPGFGEEILFRGLFISLLSAFVFTSYQERRSSKIGVVVLSSLYFALAHIYFTFAPLRLTHVDYLQLVTAFACGAFYAVVFLRTKSLLAPFLAHNFANTSATICGYIIAAL